MKNLIKCKTIRQKIDYILFCFMSKATMVKVCDTIRDSKKLEEIHRLAVNGKLKSLEITSKDGESRFYYSCDLEKVLRKEV